MNEPNPYSPPEAELRDAAATEGNEPLYFSVGTLKLVVMSLVTFGIYEKYWFYKNWVLIRERTSSMISPLGRAIFSPLWGFSFCAQVEHDGAERRAPVSLPPALYGLAYLMVPATQWLPDPFWLLGVLSVLPMISMQNAAEAVAPTTKAQTSRFTMWNGLAIVLGIALWGLMLAGTFLIEPPPSPIPE